VILLPLALFAGAAAQQPPTFAVGTEAVYVDAFVTDRHGPLTGLTAADFVLRDNGVVRPVELVALQAQPLTTLAVLDTSGSIHQEELDALRSACRALLRALQGQPVGLMTFGDEVRLRVPPTTDAAQVERALASLSVLSLGGATALYDALYVAALHCPTQGRSLLVVFSDGQDNMSWFDRRGMQDVFDGANVTLQAVGIVPEGAERAPGVGSTARYLESTADAVSFDRRRVTEDPQTRSLQTLAESTGGRFWPASASDGLTASVAAMLQAMKARYILRFEPEPARRPGRHDVSVKLVYRNGTVHCRRSYVVAAAGIR
jgi:VWFA-related protein